MEYKEHSPVSHDVQAELVNTYKANKATEQWLFQLLPKDEGRIEGLKVSSDQSQNFCYSWFMEYTTYFASNEKCTTNKL